MCVWGGIWSVKSVCTYAPLFRLYSRINTHIVCCPSRLPVPWSTEKHACWYGVVPQVQKCP